MLLHVNICLLLLVGLQFDGLVAFKIGALRIKPLRTLSMVAVDRPPIPAASLQYSPVYSFGNGRAAPGKDMKFLLGGKGANLAGMSEIGLAVPPGFTITTEVCALFNAVDRKLPSLVWDQVLSSLQTLEADTGRKLGDATRPLLVSVRSGAAISMPGMMDTVLNLGLNDETVLGLAVNGKERFAYDSYRRFLNMFGDVVLGIPHHAFEEQMNKLKNQVGAKLDSDLSAAHLKTLVQLYKTVYTAHGKEFPSDPLEQLRAAITAVFDSWMSERAIKYRSAEGVTGLLGTAVNVQAMCFGNMGETSGTGVCFTRNPNTGTKELYGEYLENAQGEDVVAGIRTPVPIGRLQEINPDVYNELIRNVDILESQFHDMQDIEFTVQEGRLFMLQTRSGKRVGPAAIKIAVDFVNEGIASTDQAILSVKPEHLNQLLHPQFADIKADTYKHSVVTKGLPASPGAAVGKVVFTPEAAEASHAAKIPCILLRDETSPEDVGGMWASEGVLTARGGMTSHAAVVARGWGKPCVCGTNDLMVDVENKIATFHIADVPHVSQNNYVDTKTKKITLREGDWVSINGDTGEVILGKQILKPPSVSKSADLQTFMNWVDKRRNLRILANADSPEDAAEARRNGAQGIGLTRTEHMFFQEDRINVVRRMILSRDPAKRQQALDELLVFQRADFEGILAAMDGLPVTVRLLDPPLHEFLPHEEITDEFAAMMDMTKEECIFAIQKMEELGLRGCRLGVVIPELVEMQARAMIEAALNNKYVKGLDPQLEVMIPLIGSAKEYTNQADIIKRTAEKVFEEHNGVAVDIKIGTMIEVPRAALTAYEVAKAGAEFFSYGTNDLTQMTYGFSRDDVGSYLPTYLKKGILDIDPFETIDEAGVGQLIDMSAAAGRKYAMESGSRNFKAGVCGEHGGDPVSVKFFSKIGLDYVSCSPFRVPLARLAAAQAVIEQTSSKAE